MWTKKCLRIILFRVAESGGDRTNGFRIFFLCARNHEVADKIAPSINV